MEILVSSTDGVVSENSIESASVDIVGTARGTEVVRFKAKLVVPDRSRDSLAMNPLSFLLVCFAGWMNRRQQAVIEYLQEEVRVLQEQLGKRPRFHR